MSTTVKYPVAHPTWYDTIRHMFTADDTAHMLNVLNMNLASYEEVSAASGEIFGQVAIQKMPPGKPWTKDMVQTFQNWMADDCPKGTPKPDQVAEFALLAAARTASRIRKDVTTLSQPDIDKLKKAFQGIMAKDPSDPNGYFVQAGYHWLPTPTYCVHHSPGYNPWHRAYLLNFENALRSVPGCEDVTLPYWDITTDFPDLLKSAPFDQYTLPQDIGGGYQKGYVTQRFPYPTIQQNLLTYTVTEDLNRALTKTDWEDFHGYWSNAPYNTIIAAHDGGHGAIGPTMNDQDVAAFDPIFWFFHANWDRLWWQWQKTMAATDLNGLLSTINKQTDEVSYDIFMVPALQALKPFTLTSVKVIDSVNSLDVDYGPPAKKQVALAFAAKQSFEVPLGRAASLVSQNAVVSVAGVNRLKIPGSFKVHLFKDDVEIGTRFFFQPHEADKCEMCVKNAIAHFDFDLPLAQVTGGKLRVEVEPVDKAVLGARFPVKLMGQPTISVRLPLQTE